MGHPAIFATRKGWQMLHQTTGTLSATPPFDFAQSLRFLGGFEPMGGEQEIAGASLTKGAWIGDQPMVFRVAGGDADDTLRYTFFAAEMISAADKRAAESHITAFLGLDDDLEPFYAIGRDDPCFAPVLARLHGYHQVRFPSPFENACWAVLTQRNPIPQAQREKQRLVERFGGTLTVDGVAHPALPPADRLAAAGPDALLDAVGNERRARYLGAVAEAFAVVDDEWLRAAPWDEVHRWLLGIAGIGAWSAAFIMLRGIGRMERLPAGEARLGGVIARGYGRGKGLTDAEIAALAEPYGDYRGYWAHYLRVAG
jgi:DNA-3-methyladenine glycosylase II